MRRAGRVAALTGTAVAAAALSVGALAPAAGMTGAGLDRVYHTFNTAAEGFAEATGSSDVSSP